MIDTPVSRFFWQSAQDAACLTDKRLVYILAAFA